MAGKQLVWDSVGERKFQSGVNKGVLYPYNATQKVYAEGVAWNGLTKVTESPSGAEVTDIYADNIKYLGLISDEKFGATIEAYTYPDQFAECDGSATIGGALVTQQTRKMFGFSWQNRVGNDTEGVDFGYDIHIVWSALAKPSSKDHSTINDSPEAVTMSWEISTTPVSFKPDGDFKDLKPTAHIVVPSKTVKKENLAELEKKLYGTETEPPTLLSPEEVLTIIKKP